MRLPIVLTGILLATPVPALAQATDTDQGQVAVDARVAPLCILGDPSRATVDLGQIAATSGLRVGRLAVLPDQQVVLPDSFCNFAGTVVTAEVDALVEQATGTPPANFAKAVNYTATVNGWAASPAAATSSAGTGGTPLTGTGTSAVRTLPHVADIGVTLSSFTAPGDLRLVAGTYRGSVRVTLGPAAFAE